MTKPETMTMKEIVEYFDTSEPTIRRRMEKREFPLPVNTMCHPYRWDAGQVRAVYQMNLAKAAIKGQSK